MENQSYSQHSRSGAMTLPSLAGRYTYKTHENSVAFVIVPERQVVEGASLPQLINQPYHFHSRSGEWRKGYPRGMAQRGRPPYNLQNMLGSPEGGWVTIVSSEQQVENIALALKKDQIVSTWAGELNEWKKTEWEPVAGKKVLLISDGDFDTSVAIRRLAKHLHFKHNCEVHMSLLECGRRGIRGLLEKLSGPEVRQMIKDKIFPYKPSFDISNLMLNKYFDVIGRSPYNEILIRKKNLNSIVPITYNNLTAGDCIVIAPLEFWLGAEDTINRKQLRVIISAFNEMAETLPEIVDEDILGLGAHWCKADGYHFHLGDRLIDNLGRDKKLNDPLLKEYYSSNPRPLSYSRAKENSDVILGQLAELILGIKWKRELDCKLYLGWLGIALGAGALKQSPTLWITGRLKSDLWWLARDLLDDYAYSVSGDQKPEQAYPLDNDFLPLMIDGIKPESIIKGIANGMLPRMSARSSPSARRPKKRYSTSRRGICMLSDHSSAKMPDLAALPIVKISTDTQDYDAPKAAIQRLNKAHQLIEKHGSDMRNRLIEKLPVAIEQARAHANEFTERSMSRQEIPIYAALCAGMDQFQGTNAASSYEELVTRVNVEQAIGHQSRYEIISNLLNHPIQYSGTQLSARGFSRQVSERHPLIQVAMEGKAGKKAALTYGVKLTEDGLLLDHNNLKLREIIAQNGIRENLRNLLSQLPGCEYRKGNVRMGLRTPGSTIWVKKVVLEEMGFKRH